MNLGDLSRDFETDFLEVWDGSDWQPNAIQGVFQTYDRFITDRTFGVKKRIFLSSAELTDDIELVRVAGSPQVYIIEAATPDYADSSVMRHSLLLRQTNVSVTRRIATEVTNAAGVATGKTKVSGATTWGDLDRYNSNKSSEFAGVVHETDILIVPRSFLPGKDDPIEINGEEFRISEVGGFLRVTELRLRRPT